MSRYGAGTKQWQFKQRANSYVVNPDIPTPEINYHIDKPLHVWTLPIILRDDSRKTRYRVWSGRLKLKNTVVAIWNTHIVPTRCRHVCHMIVKQRSFPCATLTGWCYWRKGIVFTARYGLKMCARWTWFRRLTAKLSPRGPQFNPRPVYLRFVVVGLALG